MKIYLITYIEYINNKETIFVSHGVDENLNEVVMPPEPLSNFNPKFDADGGAYIEIN